MTAATDYVGIATLVAACGTVIGTVIAAWYGRGTKHELKTYNERTVGEQVSAATSARYVVIPVGDRTDAQVQHLLDVPPEGRAVPVEAVEGNPVPPSPTMPPPPSP